MSATQTLRTATADIAHRLGELVPRRDDLRAMGRTPREDLMAGLTVAVVALPLALAFGAASGLSAQAGLVTAIIAGVVAAVFGGSAVQVSGPTGAMAVILVPVVHEFGPQSVLMVGLLAGIILIAMSWARVGAWVRFLPISVVEGFTAGIAVVIALQQLPAALGVRGDGEHVWRVAIQAVTEWLREPALASPAVALGVAGFILLGTRWRPRWPMALLALAVATVVSSFARLELAQIGALPEALPRPSLDFVTTDAMGSLLTAALAVAALAALESLLCASAADAMTVDGHHDPDRELLGQGLANVVVPFFGGMPATAAIARTAVNVRAGAVSRLSSVAHAGVLLAVVLVAAPLFGAIPLAALAGVLFATTLRMVQLTSLSMLVRSNRADAVVVLMTFAVTVLLDLVTAVAVGVAVAVVLALREVARSAQLESMPLDRGDHSEEEHALLAQHIVAYRLDGPLVFAAARQMLLELPDVVDVDFVILRMSRVTGLDATGAAVLDDTITRLERRGIVVLLSGIRPRHEAILAALGVGETLRQKGRVFPNTTTAIAAARSLLAVRMDADGKPRRTSRHTAVARRSHTRPASPGERESHSETTTGEREGFTTR